MPKIKITEVDNTGVTLLPEVSNTVYIPGMAAEAFEPELFTSVSSFKNSAHFNFESGSTPDSSYKLALRLLELGMYVLYEGFTEAPTASGIDWTRLEDKSLYDVKFLSTGAYAIPSSAMVTCAEKRGDCVALIDHPKEISGESAEGQALAVRSWFETNGYNAGSEYAAAFTPWCDISLSNSEESLPGSAAYLLAYARMAQNNPGWFAAAGSFRGVVPGLVDVSYKYTSADCEILQARSATGEVELDQTGDNVGIAINPIAYRRPFGIVVWGNRTMLKNVSGTKATSFLNIRNLISEIKKTLYNAANTYTFEQNSEVLWINFKSVITPLLDRMQSSQGINGYSIAKLATPAKARLKARISIIPIEAVEDFELEVYLEDSLETSENA